MTDKQFWDIADTYEEFDEETMQSFIPEENYKALVEDIVSANNKNYDECIADLGLFNFGDDEGIPEYCVTLCKELCK